MLAHTQKKKNNSGNLFSTAAAADTLHQLESITCTMADTCDSTLYRNKWDTSLLIFQSTFYTCCHVNKEQKLILKPALVMKTI
jgi:hypothetical protein